MIEVEKRFNPSSEALAKMLADSEFLREKTLDNIYYDFEDYSLFKAYVKLRSRNGTFELKIHRTEANGVNAEEEIENEEEIKKYFNTAKSMREFVDSEMQVFNRYVMNRKEYKNGDFIIDVDILDFGYEVVEIELMVENESKVAEAEKQIFNFAEKYHFSLEEVPSKGKKYFEIVRPDLYEQFYGKLRTRFEKS